MSEKSVWRCDECGDMYDSTDTTWRYDPVNGPQHYHSSIQGHASSTRFDDLFIADQLRARIRAIGINQISYLKEPTGCDPKEIYQSWEQHCPEILWANNSLPELNGMTPNQVIELTNKLDKILSLRSGGKNE